MTILEEIQSAAVDGQSDLGTLLRKCKVLAARLGSQPLENWVLWESNGYPDDVEVPDYRVWPLQVKGHFAGPFQSGLRNAPIPLALIPSDVRESYERYKCRQSIASLESAAKTGEAKFCVNTSDLALALGTNVYQGQDCLQAWAEFGATNIIEVLNAVRNRIFDFALALWKESPTAGELNDSREARIESAHVTQMFQTTVYGSATLVSTAPNSSVTLNVSNNDFESLRIALQQQGLSGEDIQELRKALLEDPKPTSKEVFGPKVSSWMGKMIKSAAEGAWKAGVTVGSKILSDAVMKYYGIS
jgi:hypothetical protein